MIAAPLTGHPAAPRASIALLGADEAATAALGDALDQVAGLQVQRRDGTLAQLNGTALKLTESSDLVLFRTDQADATDLEALAELRRAPGRRAILVAIAPPDISLAEARRLMDAGVADVLPWTIGADELRQHVARWTQPPADAAAPVRRGRVVAIAQARGGIGASTLAVSLADSLLDRTRLRRRARREVAVVDLDLQWGSIASRLDLPASDALWQLAADGIVPDQTWLDQALTRTSGGLWAITAPQKLAPLDALRPDQIAALIDLLAARMDYVVLDLPRTLVEWVGAAIARADRLMLMTDSSVPTVRQARRLLDVVHDDAPGVAVEIVVAQETKPLFLRPHHSEAQRLLGHAFRHWLPPDPAAARRAADRGAPLGVAAPRAPLTRAIGRLGAATRTALAAAPAVTPAAPPLAAPVSMVASHAVSPAVSLPMVASPAAAMPATASVTPLTLAGRSTVAPFPR